MTNENSNVFATMIETARVALKSSKPGVLAQYIMPKLFPQTFAASKAEGAESHLTSGVTSAIRAQIKASPQMEKADQDSFFKSHPSLFPFIQELSHGTYYVPCVENYVSIFELCESPELLDDARRFMREKSKEIATEADRLDELYNAIMRERRRPRPRTPSRKLAA